MFDEEVLFGPLRRLLSVAAAASVATCTDVISFGDADRQTRCGRRYFEFVAVTQLHLTSPEQSVNRNPPKKMALTAIVLCLAAIAVLPSGMRVRLLAFTFSLPSKCHRDEGYVYYICV